MGRNDKTVDELLKDLDNIFRTYYLKHKKNYNPYTKVLKELKQFRYIKNRDDLLFCLENKIESKETFLNFESNSWGSIFIICGLFITIGSDMILNNYNDSPFEKIPKIYFISIILFFILIEILLYIKYILGPARKKSKEKSFYKLAYEIIKQENKTTSK